MPDAKEPSAERQGLLIDPKNRKMKTFILLFLIWAAIQTANAQVPSSCNVLPVLQNYYERDVKHLALKRIFDQNSPAMDSINIPLNYQDTVWQALAAIFNMNNFPARDTVFDIYCIHQYASAYIYYNIYVQLEPSCSWLYNWQNLITPTGVPGLDTLLSTYGFTVTDFWTSLNVAILTTSQTINVRPVCDSIATFSGVVSSDPQSGIGFGDEINYSKTGTIRFLDFVIGYGDCPSGCTGSRTFQFQVNEDCTVQYLGSYLIPAPEYPFPPPVNCNITSGSEKVEKNSDIHIFPNPVEDVLNIEVGNLSYNYFSIINSSGQLMKTGDIFENKTRVSTIDLAPGLYLLIFNNLNDKERIIVKFTKL